MGAALVQEIKEVGKLTRQCRGESTKSSSSDKLAISLDQVSGRMGIACWMNGWSASLRRLGANLLILPIGIQISPFAFFAAFRSSRECILRGLEMFDGAGSNLSGNSRSREIDLAEQTCSFLSLASLPSPLPNRGLISHSRKNPRFIVQMTSASCVAQRSARPIIELQLLLKSLRNG